MIADSSNRVIRARVRANTTDFTSSNYHYETFLANQTTLTGASFVNDTNWIWANCSSAANEPSSAVIEIQNPQVTKGKNFISNNSYWVNGIGNQVRLSNGTLLNTSSYNGFTIFSDGNFSGKMYVYGYNQ